MPARKDDVLAREQLLGDAHRVARRAAVVAEHDLELAAAEHAALGVDLVLGQLHAVAIGHGERRHAAVGVELADPDRSWPCARGAPLAAARAAAARPATTIARDNDGTFMNRSSVSPQGCPFDDLRRRLT